MAKLRFLPLYASVFIFSLATAPQPLAAQSAARAARIVSPIDNTQLIALKGNVNPHANAQNDRGPVAASFAMPDLTLVLSRSPEEQAAFDAYVAGEYDQGSPNFHQWLTAAEIGERFGPADADIATISNWLASQGFAVKSVAPDKMTIRFSGTAGQVQTAFHTQIHNLSVHGAPHYANMTDPEIPAALASVVMGVKALNSFLPKPEHKLGSLVEFNKQAGKWQRVPTPAAVNSAPAGFPASLASVGSMPKATLNPRPLFGENGNLNGSTWLEEDVTPYDFATIYDVQPLWNDNITGSGETIAIAGTSFICLGQSSSPCNGANDVATYRSAFGLSSFGAPTPVQIDTGMGSAATVCTSTSSSAACGVGDLEENSLDVEASGAVAPGAQIDLVVTGQAAACNTQTGASCIDTVYDSASYVVQHHTASILSVSYGECELGLGTADNVAYYDLWQTAAGEGIAVFVATGDSGSPACDDGNDGYYGNPYAAQLGLSVSGMASTPYNTAVGGTDFSWCQPYFNGNTFAGCATSSTSQGSPAYWNTSNSSNGASAKGYVPEIPWNDTCENPILARYLSTWLGESASTPPEEVCNTLYSQWESIDQNYEEQTDQDPYIESYVDTVGGSGGVSGCVVSSNGETCATGATTTGPTTNPNTGASEGAIALVNDGWPAPTWQVNSGVAGTSGLTNRAIPDVSFFAGNGQLSSATLICVSYLGSCTYSSSITSQTLANEIEAQEVGGTSVATPEMAGVMALINQHAGGPQGLPNQALYTLASKQSYSSCSAETGTSLSSSASCYFQDIDNGPSGYSTAQTISMPCMAVSGYPEGGDDTSAPLNGQTGSVSPNCYALNSGDAIGTLATSGSAGAQAYNSTTGFDLATGLGSMNVYNVVTAPNTWKTIGTQSSNVTVTSTLSAMTPDQSPSITVTVTGTSGTPTGTVTLSGAGYISSAATLSSGSATIVIPANSLTGSSNPFIATLTASYSGDLTYASNSGTVTITVTKRTPVVTVTPASNSVNSNVALGLTVTVSGGGPTPTGSISVTGGGYSSGSVALNGSGVASLTVPANTFTSTGNVNLAAIYSGDNTYATDSNSATVAVTYVPVILPTVTVTPATNSISSSQSLSVTVTVGGSRGNGTGNVTLTATQSGTVAYTSTPPTALVNGSATIVIPANTLPAGSITLTATSTGDANYLAGSGTAASTVTVTQPTLTLTPGTPSTSAVTPGSSVTVPISGQATSTGYTGVISFSSCTATTNTANPSTPTTPPTCNISGSITYTNGTPSGSATATVYTTAASSAELVTPKLGNGRGWLGGGGAVLAFLVFLGIPARRRSWRSMLGLAVLLAVALGGMAACGGGGGGGSVSNLTPATAAGNYTFAVTGQGNDAAKTTVSTTFTVTVQ